MDHAERSESDTRVLRMNPLKEYWKYMKRLEKDIQTAGKSLAELINPIGKTKTMEEKKKLLHQLSISKFYTLVRNDFEIWVDDTVFIVNSLHRINQENMMLNGGMDIDNVGIFGHSFGGAVAGGEYVINSSGMNDAFYFAAKQAVCSMTVQGAAHHNFSDLTYIQFLKNTPVLGPIDNKRAGSILNAYTLAFFNKYLKGIDSPLLTGDSPRFPEVILKSRNTI